MDDGKSLQTYFGFILVKKNNGKICGRYPVKNKECSLGRSNTCDIRILLENVSAQHCIIYYIDDKAFIRDKSVTGSTKVNGKSVGRNNFLLHDSDEIDICGRKFVWEYAYSRLELNNLSSRKSGTRNNCTTPKVLEQSSNQVNTPLVQKDSNKISTPAKSSMKSSSKTLISINKTPIVVATTNMSRYSYDEVKNSLKKQNSIAKSEQSEPRLMRSYSMVPGRNIPVIGDSKVTKRKSWVVTNDTPANSSSNGVHILNRLSSERLKRDSTPEFNCSYHYEDDDVQFDSPEPTYLVSNYDNSVDTSCLYDNNLSMDNLPESVIVQNDNDPLSNNMKISKLPDSEPEIVVSRRDTYSIDNRPIEVEQNSTPAPRRSILKCSKTAKPNRSRSTCRMVQFARLPKSDSRIKMSKSRFNPGSNFVITDDDFDKADFAQNLSKSMHFNVEEFDDDLDGVQPLDGSISSLISSPILDTSCISKSSKRGSRGTKVMSLVNSFEKRTNESPKNSIRASDLLTSGSKHINTPTSNDSPTNSKLLQESVSSTRRINLENIFEAEDSLKNASLDRLDETHVQEVESSEKDEVINSKIHTLNNTDTENVTENDTESEYNYSSPLKLWPTVNSSAVTVSDTTNLTSVDFEHEHISKIIENTSATIICKPNVPYFQGEHETSLSKFSTVSGKGNIEKSSNHGINNLLGRDDIDDISVDSSMSIEQSKNKNICLTDKVEVQCNVSQLIDKTVDMNNGSKSVEQISDGESPSMIIQHMSEMMNNSVDELETTHSQNMENNDESYVFVGIKSIQDSPKEIHKDVSKMNTKNISDNEHKLKDETEETSDVIKNIAARLSEMFGNSDTSLNEKETIVADSILNASFEKTITPGTVLEETESKNINVETIDVLASNTVNTLKVNESIKHVSDSVSKAKSFVEDSVHSNCDKKVKNSSKSSNLNKISSLDKSKHSLNDNSSKQFDQSFQSTKYSPVINVPTIRKTRSFKKSIELPIFSTSDNERKIENKGKTIVADSMLNESNNKLITPRIVLEETESENINVETTDVLASTFMNTDKVNESVEHVSDSVYKTKSFVEDSVHSNSVKKVKNNSKSSNRNKISSLDKSKHSLNDNSSKQFDQSFQSTKYSPVIDGPTIRKTRSFKKSIELPIFSASDDENTGKTIDADSILNVSYEKITPGIVLEETESENINVETTDVLASNTVNTVKVNESIKNVVASASKIKSFVEDCVNSNRSSTIDNCNIRKVPIGTPENESNTVKNSNTSNSFTTTSYGESISLPETIPINNLSNDEKVKNNSKNSEQFDPSFLSTKYSLPDIHEPAIRKTRSSTRTMELPIFSASDDERVENKDKTHKNLEHSMDTYIGKPQYESTPWSSSRNSKTNINSTASKECNETTLNDIFENNDKIRKSRNRSPTPFPEPEVWSQMLREFNESVKKASISQNCISDVNTSCKILFGQDPTSSPIVNQVTTEDSLPSDYKNIKKSTIVQCLNISSFCPNLKTSNDLSKRSTRQANKSMSPRRSSGVQDGHPISIKNSDVISLSKDNSIGDKTSTKIHEQSGTSTVLSNTSLPSDYKNIKKNTIVQCLNISSFCPNLKTSNDLSKRSTRQANKSMSPRRSSGVQDGHPISIKNSDVISLSKDNSIGDKTSTKIHEQSGTSTVLSNTSSVDIRKKSSSSMFKTNTSRPTKNKNNTPEIITDIESDKDMTSESETDQSTKSNSSKYLRVPSRTKLTIRQKNKNSSPPTRRQLRTRANKNELSKPIKNHANIKTIISEGTSTSSEMNTSKSTIIFETSEKELRPRRHNVRTEQSKKTTGKDTIKHVSPIKKNVSANKIKVSDNEKKITPPIKPRITRSNSTLSVQSIQHLDKKNKTSSPAKSNSAKVGKSKQSKISKSQPKRRFLPSEPVKTNSSDSSEYVTDSEIEDTQNAGLLNNQLKTNKEKAKKKNVKINNDSTSLPTKQNQKDSNDNASSHVSPQLTTRSRKRAAGTPFSQPKAKGLKHDNSSKVANVTRVSNSPQTNTSFKKLTRNISKIITQGSDNSFPEATTSRKEKPKSHEKTGAKKRVLVPEDSSSDSAPSTRKTRKAAFKDKETEIKKSNRSNPATSKNKIQNTDTDETSNSISKITQGSDNSFPEATTSRKEKPKSHEKTGAKKRVLVPEDSSSDSAPSTRKTRKAAFKDKETEVKKSNRLNPATSKNKIQNTDTDETSNSSKVKFDKNVVEISITPKKTRSTKQAVQPAKESPPAVRVLRVREKRK